MKNHTPTQAEIDAYSSMYDVAGAVVDQRLRYAADIAFKEHAANCHADLVAALQGLLAEANLYATEHRPKLTKLCDNARTALAKAESAGAK